MNGIQSKQKLSFRKALLLTSLAVSPVFLAVACSEQVPSAPDPVVTPTPTPTPTVTPTVLPTSGPIDLAATPEEIQAAAEAVFPASITAGETIMFPGDSTVIYPEGTGDPAVTIIIDEPEGGILADGLTTAVSSQQVSADQLLCTPGEGTEVICGSEDAAQVEVPTVGITDAFGNEIDELVLQLNFNEANGETETATVTIAIDGFVSPTPTPTPEVTPTPEMTPTPEPDTTTFAFPESITQITSLQQIRVTPSVPGNPDLTINTDPAVTFTDAPASGNSFYSSLSTVAIPAGTTFTLPGLTTEVVEFVNGATVTQLN